MMKNSRRWRRFQGLFLMVLSLCWLPPAQAQGTSGQVYQWGWQPGAMFQIRQITNVVQVTTGLDFSVALQSDGTVWSWGSNQFGALGDGTTNWSTTPVQVVGLSGITAIAAGSSHTLARKQDGSVWAWGHNYYRQLGDGTGGFGSYSATPVQVSGLTNVIAVSAGNGHSLALKSDGTVWVWGNSQTTVSQVSGLTNIIAISAGSVHSLALRSDGTVWAWGTNRFGQLGDGSLNDSVIPVQAVGLTQIIAISAGGLGINSHSMALRADGTVWTWGDSSFGQMGVGFSGNGARSSTPLQVSNVSGIVAISAGSLYSLSLKSDGTLWAWGDNSGGGLGDGTTIRRSVPTAVIGLLGIETIAAGKNHNTALKSDGTVWGWGSAEAGQLGDMAHPPKPVSLSADITHLAGGHRHTLAIKSDGTAWAWGDNSYGQLGDGTKLWRTDPIPVNGINNVISVAAAGNYYAGHSLAAKSDGTVWAWGENANGQLGDGTRQQKSVPVKLNSLNHVVAVAAGSRYSAGHSLALTSEGTVWSWGYNSNGQLGDGTTFQRDSPVMVAGLTGITAIAAGGAHNLALAADGLVWAWGSNSDGQLGDNTTTDRLTPVVVQGVYDVVSIAAGDSYSFALKADGTVWAWGNNDYGRLGDGTMTDRYTPTLLSSLSNVVEITAGGDDRFHNVARTSNGTVWAWGDNTYGQVGDETRIARLLPVEISSLHGAVKVVAGGLHTLAIMPVATLSGSLLLADLSLDAPAQPVTFTFRPVNGGSEIVKQVAIGPAGNVSLPGIPRQEYVLHMKGAKWLAKTIALDTSSGDVTNLNASLIPGDGNNDNSVDVLDLDALILAFDAAEGDSNWNNGVADFNCDGWVDVLDLDLLIRYFDRQGDS